MADIYGGKKISSAGLPKPVKEKASQGAKKAPKGPTVPATFMSNWQKRVPALKQAGYKPKHIQAVYQYDLKQVESGKKGFSDQQAYTAAHALSANKDIFKIIKHNSGGGLLGDLGSFGSNAIHDVAGIAEAINPPHLATSLYKTGVGALATAGLLLENPTTSSPKSGAMEFVDSIFSHIPAYNEEAKQRDQLYGQMLHKTAKGDYGGAISDELNLPGTALIPGTYTAANVARGDFGAIGKHPVSTVLDLLPMATKLGVIASGGEEAARTATLADDAANAAGTASDVGKAGKLSAKEAFQQGKFVRGVTRSVAGTKPITAESSARAVQAASKWGIENVPRSSEYLANMAEKLGVSHIQRDIYEHFNVTGRQFQKAGVEARDAQMENFAKDLSPEDQSSLYEAVTTGDPVKLNSLSPELRGRASLLRDMRDTAAANDLQSRGFIGMEFNGKTYYYHPNSPVGRARKLVTRTRDSYGRTVNKVVGGDVSNATMKELERRATIMGKAEKNLAKKFHDSPPREFFPVAYEKTKANAEQALQDMRYTAGKIDQPTYERALESLRNDQPESLWADNLISEKEWGKWLKANGKSWQDLAQRQGFDPVYVPNAAESQIRAMFNAKPKMETGAFTPSQFKNAKLTQFRPEVAHVALQMSHSDLQQLATAVQDESLRYMTDSYAMDRATIRRLEQQAHNGSDLGLKKVLKEKYYTWSEASGLLTGTSSKIARNEDLYLPRAEVDAMQSYLKQYTAKGGISGNMLGVYDKALRGFRVAITTSPRHVVHVAATGVLRATGEQGLTWIPQVAHAWKLAHEGIPELGSSVALDTITSDEGRAFLEGQIHAKTLMDHLPGLDKAKAGFHWYRQFEEHVGETLKVSSMLAAEKKGLASGLSGEDARMQAIDAANRIHMDLDRMSPIERNVLRRVFPFYGFTSEMLRYMFQYPADHPVAAAIISRMALMEQQDNATGLPQMFGAYFQSVGPMQSDGTQSFIDTKSLSPFRSIGNAQSPFTLAGFTSALNPAAQTGLRILGVDPLSASTNPYAEQQVDPFTGSEVSTHAGWAGTALNTFFPQSALITDYVAQVPVLNKLKLTDPKGYRTSIFSALGVPSTLIVPFKKNLYDERIKLQNKYFTTTRSQLSGLIKSGDYSGIQKYDFLPYHGQTLTPDTLIKFLKGQQ